MGLDYTKRAGAVYGSRLHKESRRAVCGSTETTLRQLGLYMGLDYTKRARAVYRSTETTQKELGLYMGLD